jgi:hypothetical protein
MRIYPWLADDCDLAPIPFPTAIAAKRSAANAKQMLHGESTDDLLTAFATVSRKINDLARELKCLGYFDDSDCDRPRAA